MVTEPCGRVSTATIPASGRLPTAPGSGRPRGADWQGPAQDLARYAVNGDGDLVGWIDRTLREDSATVYDRVTLDPYAWPGHGGEGG